MTLTYNQEIQCYEWEINGDFNQDLQKIRGDESVTKILVRRINEYECAENTRKAFEELRKIDRITAIELGESVPRGPVVINILDIPNMKAILENPRLKRVNLYWDNSSTFNEITDSELTQIIKLLRENRELKNEIGITDDDLDFYAAEKSIMINPDKSFDAPRDSVNDEEKRKKMDAFDQKLRGYVNRIINRRLKEFDYVNLEHFEHAISAEHSDVELLKGQHRMNPFIAGNEGRIAAYRVKEHLDEHKEKEYDKSTLVISQYDGDSLITVDELEKLLNMLTEQHHEVKNIRFCKGVSIIVKNNAEMLKLSELAKRENGPKISDRGIVVRGMDRFNRINTEDAKDMFLIGSKVTPEQEYARDVRRIIMSNFDIETKEGYARTNYSRICREVDARDPDQKNTDVTTLLNEALKQVFNDNNTEFIKKIKEEAGTDNKAIQRIGKQLIRDILPHLEEEGLKMQKDGIADWGTRLTWVKDYVTAWCQEKIMGKEGALKKFEDKYLDKDKVLVAGNSKLSVDNQKDVNNVKEKFETAMKAKFTEKENQKKRMSSKHKEHDM